MIIRNLNEIKYENESSEFVIKNKDFKFQYAPLYSERLSRMRNCIQAAAKHKWKSSVEVRNLAELVTYEKCIIIGTLYKEMKNKPSILKEMAEDGNEEESSSVPFQPVLNRDAKYIDPDGSDILQLEDELQRITLVDAPHSKCKIIASNRLCTGIRSYSRT